MIDLVRSSALHALDRAEHLIGIGARAGLMEARLAPGMFTFGEQIAVAVGMARRAVLPLIGREANEVDADGKMALRAAIAEARDAIRAEGAAAARVAHRAGFADLDQTAEDYAARFALPNLWFHLSMAYAVLRANGVAVSKADFDGLHHYPKGFMFED